MGVMLRRHGVLTTDPGPQPIRRACLNARQLYALSAPWSELQNGRLTGLYQASGRERLQQATALQALVAEHGGLHVVGPEAMIYEYLPYGPFARLAMFWSCLGPFSTHSGDELSVLQALTAAFTDLDARRCEQALVGGVAKEPGSAWLMLLDHPAEGGVRWHVRYTAGRETPSDEDLRVVCGVLNLSSNPALIRVADTPPITLMDALATAQTGKAVLLWQVTADRRGLLLGLAGEP